MANPFVRLIFRIHGTLLRKAYFRAGKKHVQIPPRLTPLATRNSIFQANPFQLALVRSQYLLIMLMKYFHKMTEIN